MAWVKLDDEYTDHPKVVDLGPVAQMLNVAALCYANHNRTDGAIPASTARRLIDLDGLSHHGEPVTPKDLADQLVDAGLWHTPSQPPCESDLCPPRNPTGFTIHDYFEYQPSRADLEELSAKRSEAGKKGAAAKQQAKQLAEQRAKQDAEQKSAPVSRSPVPGSRSSGHGRETPTVENAHKSPPRSVKRAANDLDVPLDDLVAAAHAVAAERIAEGYDVRDPVAFAYGLAKTPTDPEVAKRAQRSQPAPPGTVNGLLDRLGTALDLGAATA